MDHRYRDSGQCPPHIFDRTLHIDGSWCDDCENCGMHVCEPFPGLLHDMSGPTDLTPFRLELVETIQFLEQIVDLPV